MIKQQPRRRAILGQFGGVVFMTSLGFSVAAQEPPSLALPPTDQFHLSHQYPRESIDGYTKFTMDRLLGLETHFGDGLAEGTAAVGYLRAELFIAATEAGTATPIILTNFVDKGPPGRNPFEALRSDQQSEMFEEILPEIAAHSKRPIVLLEVTAIGQDAEGKPEGVFLGSLMAAVQENTLGPGHVPVEIPEDSWVVPYFEVHVGFIEIYDASFKQYGTDFTVNEIKAFEAASFATSVDRSNESLD